MTFGLDYYELSVLTIFLLLIPTACYVMGLLEGNKGRYLFISGIFFHTISIIQRWLVVGRLPLASKHDNLSFMAFAMALIYLYFSFKKDLKTLSLIIIPMIAAFMFIAVGHRPVNTLSPFMNSTWFFLHVFFYFLSYGFFGVAACIGGYYVLTNKSDYELLQYRGIMYGWIMLSVSLFMGSIWFYAAYGTYWLWTSKELWITATWLFYGLYLHARFLKGLRGRPAAALGSLGFAVALFTYFGVGTIIKSPPTQF